MFFKTSKFISVLWCHQIPGNWLCDAASFPHSGHSFILSKDPQRLWKMSSFDLLNKWLPPIWSRDVHRECLQSFWVFEHVCNWDPLQKFELLFKREVMYFKWRKKTCPPRRLWNKSRMYLHGCVWITQGLSFQYIPNVKIYLLMIYLYFSTSLWKNEHSKISSELKIARHEKQTIIFFFLFIYFFKSRTQQKLFFRWSLVQQYSKNGLRRTVDIIG